VEIQEPLSTPVPMPPSILSSEAFVIWILRIAMKAPIIAAVTDIHTAALARFGFTATLNAGETAGREAPESEISDMTSPR